MYVQYSNNSSDTTPETTATTTTMTTEVYPDHTIISMNSSKANPETITTIDGNGNNSTTTTMPSSPETSSYCCDPTTTTITDITTNNNNNTSTLGPSIPLSTHPPPLRISNSSTQLPVEDRFTTCTGLSALIQAATSQLLAEIASAEYIIHEQDHDNHNDNDDSPATTTTTTTTTAKAKKSQRRTSFVTPTNHVHHHPITNTKPTKSRSSTPTIATTTPPHPPLHLTTQWKEESLPEQLMKLLLRVRWNETLSRQDSRSIDDSNDMISFLPNGKYFVVQKTVFTQYLRDTEHSFYYMLQPPSTHLEYVKKENDKDVLVNEMVIGMEHPSQTSDETPTKMFSQHCHHDVPMTESTSFPNDHSDSNNFKKSHYHRTRKTRIRTFPEFVHTLLYRYQFTWIDHRYISSSVAATAAATTSSSIISSTTPNEGDNILPPVLLPNHSPILYPEIMVFYHELFQEQNSSLCQQIPYCCESSVALLPPRPSQDATVTNPSQSSTTAPTVTALQHKTKYFARHNHHHSKVVHNHHTVVVAALQQPTGQAPSPESNEPTETVTTDTGTTSSITSRYNGTTTPSSPIVVRVEETSTITKRRLSPGFLRQQEQKNGAATSKQKVQMDLSNGALPPGITDISTSTNNLGINEDCYYCDATTMMTTTASTTTNVATTNMIDGTDPMTSTICTTSTNNEGRKLSSGCESDMTNMTTQSTDRKSVV